jgi:tetratricopeptide (TPR) repeat protein
VTVTGVRSVFGLKRTISSDSILFSTSGDSVGAPIYYRDVPLPFRFALRNVPMIRWRLGHISSQEPPPTVLTNLPVCGNCHSFSNDGKMLGMDVDIGNDKGAYVLTPFEEETILSRDRLISWSDFVRDEKVPTFGMLPRVSPTGRFVLAGVKDRTVFLPREDILFSQIFFPVMGILAYYDTQTGTIHALPGADDENFVQTNGVWTPDGQQVIFARNRAVRLQTRNEFKDILLSTEESAEVLGGEEFLYKAQEGGNRFRFNLYRMPFNEGKGGIPEPIPGASNNDMSNFFPAVSPDGKWLVFTQAHSFMLLQPDSKLYIMPLAGGEPRLMNANTDRMNSWHSWSPNSKWLVFSSKEFGPYTQLFLTHIDEEGNDAPPVLLRNFTATDRAANIPEFVNIAPGSHRILKEQFVDDYNFFRAGRIYQQFQELDRAEEEFVKAVRLNPENTFSWYALAEIYEERENFDEALRLLQQVLEVDPDAPIPHNDLGELYFKMKQYDNAEREFRKAVELDGGYVAARFNLGTIFLMNNRLVDAEREFRQILTLDLDSTAALLVHSNLARICITRRDQQCTIREYSAAISYDSSDMDVRHNLGVAYRAVNDLQRAREQFEAILQLDSNDVDARIELGQVLLAANDLRGAQRELARVRALRPRDLTVLMPLAQVYYETRQFEEAEEVLREALALEPGNLYAHVHLGRTLHEANRYDEAAAEFRTALQIQPNDARIWFMLGETLIRHGQSGPEAVQALERGLALQPDYVEGYVSLGDLCTSMADSAGAIRAFEAALELNRSDTALDDYLQTRIDDLRRR